MRIGELLPDFHEGTDRRLFRRSLGTHPHLTGREGEVVLGKKSGKMSISYNLEKLGYDTADDKAIEAMLSAVKTLGIDKRGLVTDEEFRVIADKVLGKAA